MLGGEAQPRNTHFPPLRARPLIDGGCNFIRPVALRDSVVLAAELSRRASSGFVGSVVALQFP